MPQRGLTDFRCLESNPTKEVAIFAKGTQNIAVEESFLSAFLICADSNAELFEPTSDEELQSIVESFFKFDVNKNFNTVWIDISASDGDGDILPSDFKYISGKENDFIPDNVGTFPWRNNEPDVLSDKDCAISGIVITNTLEWQNVNCNEEHVVLCFRECRTPLELNFDDDDNDIEILKIISSIFVALIGITLFFVGCQHQKKISFLELLEKK